ncbi:MAG: SDR family NAD(P)-dependent oxidoreductase [Treponema sp.]|uniref:SDR family NAD(P)-dependent oxidoreductase n=1 Tax=Treponema sp. TaxID=166 RepID=UPI00298D9AD8|nr:SDR family NAD(P)-dependent oxidoreductase [Treponema sp.]MCI5697194.1 SDR family NAD(P)-dependent oxidoreductase [Spirochaetia bacterium]MDD5811205.1 SDR family NAD(P)-dependent oxidoreductase [Treponema sp.]
MKRIAIITGASSGMGTEFTKELFLNSENYKFGKFDEIWILARRSDRLKNLKYDLEKAAENNCSKEYPEITAIEIDLSGTKGVTAFNAILKTTKKVESKNGGFEIGLLVNNAGFGTYGEFTETPLDKELEMIDTNCSTLTGLCGLAIPFMNEKSTIINVASLAAFLPLGNFAVYAATKSYVLSFSVALAAELKDKGIHVLAMCPGSVSTEFANVASNGARKEVLHGYPADKTVKHALKCASNKKHIALWAHKWKITAFFSRFIGRFFGARFTFIHNKRPYRK